MGKLEKAQWLVFLISITLCLTIAWTHVLKNITFDVIVPNTTLLTVTRRYTQTVKETLTNLVKYSYQHKFNLTKSYMFSQALVKSIPALPNPLQILKVLCESLMFKNVVAILYFTNENVYGSNAASAQYLLQLTGYLGIPVIAWNPDHFGLQQQTPNSIVLQLAPSFDHQLEAIWSILKRYSWYKFSIVTSQVGGHENFIHAAREKVVRTTGFEILDIFTLKGSDKSEYLGELEDLANSEARIIVLHCTKDEAEDILDAANDLKITGAHYVWIATQAVIGPGDTMNKNFPPGMLGVHCNITTGELEKQIEKALHVLFHGLELFVNDPCNANITLTQNFHCYGTGDVTWTKGMHFFKYLRSVNIRQRSEPNITFNTDNHLTYVTLHIMNMNKKMLWEKVGTWNQKGLTIKDIIWPGDSTTPPRGTPEKFNLKVAFMEEPPYINIVAPDNETGECKTQRAVKCRIAPESEMIGVNTTVAMKNTNFYKCCAGYCIDLLREFSNDLRFTYDLYRVEDGKWGALHNGTWNGLIADLLSHKADIVVTSIKINSERQSAVDFTVPFLETGIAIVVAKRTGIISPKAFLEPFDTISWIMILWISIQAAAIAIFAFEWLSPSGYDRKKKPSREESDLPSEHKFSLFRTYWLVWAILFGAAVNVDCPRGYTARFMSNVWAMFAVVFLAIYTANLAAFMITREEYYDLSGIEDNRLQYPMSVDPPFRYGTIPHGNTESVLKRNKPDLYHYMKKYNKEDVKEGVKAVKMGVLDAFIYDATVLEYLVGQDNECRLLTVGSWYAMTGYGFALPKKSKHLNDFNREMIKYRQNGDLERFQRFWLQGACKPTKTKRNVSKPLDVNQFMSAFLLLGCGVLFTILLLGLEHVYFRYIRQHLAKKDTGGCFTLISLSMGRSLSFRGAVFEAQDMLKHHRCKDPICDTQLWKAKHELDMANLRIRQLEAELSGKSYSDYYFHSSSLHSGIIRSEDKYYPPPRFPTYCRTPSTTEIAEIETVL